MVWDPRAAATAHVRDLPLFTEPDAPTEVEVRYAAWLETTDGKDLFSAIERVVLDEAAHSQRRVSVYRAFEIVRGRPPYPSIDNRFRALVARDLAARHRIVAEKIELRDKTGRGG